MGERELDDTEQPTGLEQSVEELRRALLRRQLAAGLDLDPDTLNALGPDLIARLLTDVREIEGSGTATSPRAAAGPSLLDPELVPRVLRAELAERLHLDPGLLTVLGPAPAAALLAKLAGGRRPNPDAGPGGASRLFERERRDLVNRTLRDELARELGVPAATLAAVSPEVVVLAFHRLVVMGQEASSENGRAMPEPRPERRDPVARTLRQELGDRLGLPVRELSGLSTATSALLLRRLQEEGRRSRQFERLARTDELTGALRREPGLEALRVEIARARRLADFRFVVAYLDVEGLEAVSEAEGHARADQLVKELSTAIVGRLRGHDLVIRWGGDEFVCALPQTDVESARAIFDQLRTHFEDTAPGCRLAIGLAALQEGDTATDLVHTADENLRLERRRQSRPQVIEPAPKSPPPERPRPWWRR